MLTELIIRFVVGGIIVSIFAVIGEIIQPKSFAGIFGAAPSVALATMGLAFAKYGGSDVAITSRSMVIGAAALFFYSLLVGQLLLHHKKSLLAATLSLPLWIVIAFGLKTIFLT